MLELILAAALAATPIPSLRFDAPVVDPERIAGVWEGAIGANRIAGLSIGISTDVPQPIGMFAGQPQIVTGLAVTTYVRTTGSVEPAGAARAMVYSAFRGAMTWWDNSMPGNFVIEDARLRFHQDRADLDLSYDTRLSVWRGWYKTPYHFGEVVLARPAMSVPGTPAGEWIDHADSCLHIGIGQDGYLVLWGDSLERPMPNAVRGSGAQPFRASYGQEYFDTKSAISHDAWSFRLAGIDRSFQVHGKLSADGQRFAGTLSDHEGNGIFPLRNKPVAFVWHRSATDECPSAL